MIPKNLKSKGFLWIFAGILILSAMLFSASTLPKCSADTSSPLLLVVPAQTTLTSPTIGTLFNVSVDIANTTGFAGVQFTLSWNTSFLMCTQMTEVLYHNVTPTSYWSNIWDLSPGIDNTAGTGGYAVTYLNGGLAVSDGYSPINVTTANFPDGEETVDTFTFNVTSVPPPSNVYQSDFTLGGVVIGDVSGAPITVTSVNGQLMITGPPAVNVTSVSNPWTGITDNITTVSNATLVQDSMTYDNNTYTLSFNLTGTEGTTGYVNVTVPTDIVSLNQTTDQWIVTVNGTPVTPIISSNATDTFFYITVSFDQGVPITITGTLPEFSTLMMIPLLATATMVVVVLRRRRRM